MKINLLLASAALVALMASLPSPAAATGNAHTSTTAPVYVDDATWVSDFHIASGGSEGTGGATDVAVVDNVHPTTPGLEGGYREAYRNYITTGESITKADAAALVEKHKDDPLAWYDSSLSDTASGRPADTFDTGTPSAARRAEAAALIADQKAADAAAAKTSTKKDTTTTSTTVDTAKKADTSSSVAGADPLPVGETPVLATPPTPKPVEIPEIPFSQGIFLEQVGDTNQADITQTGVNAANVSQKGNKNKATVSQKAKDGGTNTKSKPIMNKVGIIQKDDNETATVTQEGMGDEALILQRGGGNTATIDQLGDSNDAEIAQIGGQDIATVTQTGNRDKASISQKGSLDVATVTQTGDDNEADIIQEEANNTATITQNGNTNLAQIYQITAGNTADITQTGNGNTAKLTQQ